MNSLLILFVFIQKVYALQFIESDFFENSSNSIRQLLMFNFGLTKDSLDCFISYKKKCFNKEKL